MVPYKITWFKRGWVGLDQLIWAIVVPIPGHLDVYSWSGGHCKEHDPRSSSKESRKGHHQTEDQWGTYRRTYEAVHGRFGQFYGRFYRHGLSFTDTRIAFAGCLLGFTDTVQLFLVLATYCVVLGPIPSAEHLIERTLTHLSP